jgi:hypothetical protein
MNNALTKAIPVSLALTLFASGNVFAANQKYIAVKDDRGNNYTFDVKQLNDNPTYRKSAIDILTKRWLTAAPIFYSDDGKTFTDFSAHAEPGKTLAQVLAVANHNNVKEYFEITSLDELITVTPDTIDSIY